MTNLRSESHGGEKDPPTVTAEVVEAPAALPTGPAPTAPKGMTDAEVAALKARAASIAAELESAAGSKELETVDSVSNLGLQSQRTAAGELNLLRARVGDMMTREGPTATVTHDMTELRTALNQINPHEMEKQGFFGRLFSVGLLGSGANALRNRLERIAIRYEPISRQITVIETRLREGRAMLARDNVELRKLYEAVEAQQLPVKKNAFLGELIMRELESLYQRTDDLQKRERVRALLHDVALRVQDLRTMEEVDVQFFLSIDMTRQNNTRLAQAVERTLALSTNVIMVGLAVQMALMRQKRVMEANARTREFLGNIIVTNAAVLKRHTSEIGDAYNNPVIAIDKLAQAHQDLIEALDTADRIKQEGITHARENIARLSQMSSELEQRMGALKEAEVRTVEA